MTLIEKVQELQAISPPLKPEEITAKVAEWKSTQPVETVEEGKTTDSSQANPSEESSSEVTDSNSEDGSSESSTEDFDFLNGDLSEVLKDDSGFKEGVQKKQQEAYDKFTAVAKPDEVITKGGWDMKYTADGSYYTKKKGANNWIKLEEGTNAFGSISNVFGHSDFDLKESKKNSKMFSDVGNIFNPKPRSVSKEQQSIDDIIANDNTGAFVVPVATKLKVDKKIAEKQNEIKGLSIMDPKAAKIQEEINALKLSIDPVQTAIYKTEQFNKDTALTDSQVNSIRQKTIDFMSSDKMVPEVKVETERVKIGSEGGKPIYDTITTKTETGRMIPNPELEEITAEAKSDLAATMKVSVEDLKDDPKTQEKLDAIIREKYTQKLESKAEDKNIKSWIHKNRDLFTKGEAQERQALYAKVNQLDVNKRENQVLKTVKDAQNDIGTIRKAMKQLSQAEYQSQEEVDKANKLFKKLRSQEKKLVGVYSSEYEKIDDILTDKKSLAKSIDFLERNYSFTANFVTSAGMAGVDLGQSLEEVLFRLADAPNAFDFADNKVFTALTPFSAMAAAIVDSDTYKDKRKEINNSIDAWQNGITEGMAKPVELSEISSISDIGMFSAQMIGSQIPNTAILMATGGTGLYVLGASSAGSSFQGMQSDIDQSKKAHDEWIANGKNGPEPDLVEYNPYQMYGVATLNGVTEVLSERISLGIINRSQKAFNLDGAIKKGFVDQVKSIFTKSTARTLKVYGVDTVGESFSEGGVQLASNIFDNVILGKSVPLLEGVPTSMVSGAMMSGLVYKSPGLAKGIINMTQSVDSNQKIKQNFDKIKELETSLRPPNVLSSKARGIVSNKIADLVKSSSTEINKGLQRFSTMPIETVRELSQIEADIFDIRNDMEVLNNETGFKEGKEAAVKQLKDAMLDQQIKKSKLIAETEIIQNPDGTVPVTTRDIQQGSDVVAEQLGDVGINRFDTTEDLLGGLETLKEQGIQVNVRTNEDGTVKDAKEQDYGLIATLPNGTKQVIINNASSQADGVMPADKHEIFHVFAGKMDPAKLSKMGKDLFNSIKNDPNIEIDKETLDLLDQYETDLNDGVIDEAGFYEEVMAVTSDALTPDVDGNTSIKVKEVSGLKAIGNKILETIGWKQSFKDGNQVVDFLKAFNKDVVSGKGLSQETLDKAEVDMGLETEVDLGTVKSSKVSQAKNQKLVREAKRGDLKAVDALIKDNSGIILQKLGFNKDIGDVTSQDILNVVKDQAIGKGLFKGRQKPLFDNYNPTKGEVSTYLGDIVAKRKAEIFKAAGLDATKFDTVSTDAPQAQQVADTTEQTEFDEVTNEEKGRKKVYPSNMPSISKNIKPESIASINEGAKRDILLNASKGIDAIVSSIKSESKNTAKILGKDVGTFAKGWPKFVNELVNDGLTKVIPAAALKRRFGNVLNIKKTGTTPTKRVNPTTGKVTTFNKPVYEIPKADNQSLIDYFTGQEKRRTSLLEVLGQDLVVEQLQELKNDADFMTKLDSLTNGKASEIMDSIDSKLDARNLEDTSLDTVKASKKKIKNAADNIDIDSKIKDQFVDKVETILEKNPEVTLEEAIEFEAARIGKSRGFAYENVIIDKLKKLKIPGFKVSGLAGGNAVGIPDFASTIFDSNFDVEVKLEKAQYSSVTLKHRNELTTFSKDKEYSFVDRLTKDLISKAKKPLAEYRKKAGELGADLDLYDKTGKLPLDIYTQLQKEGFQKAITQTAKFNQDIISELYQKKIPPTNYIQIKNKGLFSMGSNPLNLPIPQFKADVNVTLRVSRGSRTDLNGVEMTTMNLRILPDNLTNLGVSDFSLDNVSQMESMMNTPQVKMLELNEQANENINNPILPDAIKFSKKKGGNTIVEAMTNADKALEIARKLNQPIKKIRVFDFDDTLAKTNSQVLVTTIDGKIRKINATQFALESQQLEAEGAEFDFSEFSQVIDGKKGPLFDLAKKIADSPGKRDMFILTARPQNAANGIKTFLDGIGLNIPIENITGLQDGAPEAKARWMVEKAAEGYNDFYFADDALKNVKAVKDVLSTVDVKSKVQLAKASKKKVFNKVFNDIIENSTGIKSYKVYSPAKAQTIGASKGKFDFLIPASAEDFTGLLYKTLGKGKVGDAQMAFYKTNLLDPYNRAEIAVVNAKIAAANDFKALKNNLKTLPKSLSKLTGVGKFTFSQASRVAVWTRQGMTVPGLSKTDLKQLNDFVDNNAELNTFADELIKIQKGKPYPAPTKTWVSGTITSDITTEINKVNRKEYMQEFQENADIIFSDENMSKLEAAYGPKYVEALKDNLRRMKSGSNRPIGGSRVVNNVLDWLNNSVGAVMFLNTRSAILQTISAVNFVQVSGPNNLLAAGKAFANQKQYWKDFMTLMNSPYLVERRNGLKINVSESEIADAVAESKNKPKAALAYLLSKGFVMTRFADSFAIASGGSTFYRNTVDALVKSGMDQKSAEKKAFDDFRALAEESQQSSNPSRISQQQASAAGRVILAFANTPMQYARIIKKSSQDLINGRGDWKSNVSKIAYYGAMQNVVFNALQQALFALAFSDDEEEKEKQKKDKTGRIVNGMVDSLIKGAGIQGQAVIAIKNAIIKIAEEADKKSPEFQKAVDDLLGFSPPLSAKIRKIKGGLKAFSWSRKEMKEKGFDLNNPAYLASAQVISGLTNIPVDRAIKKLNNIRAIFSDSSAKWQKVAMALGWSTWDVGLPFYGVEDKEIQTPQTILRDKVSKMKKETSGPQQKQMLLDLGLTKKEIKALRYEENRIKKIIELQNKNKK